MISCRDTLQPLFSRIEGIVQTVFRGNGGGRVRNKAYISSAWFNVVDMYELVCSYQALCREISETMEPSHYVLYAISLCIVKNISYNPIIQK